jgi:hypothetical protein
MRLALLILGAVVAQGRPAKYDEEMLFILDLDKGMYESSSTESGAFDEQPDQASRAVSVVYLRRASPNSNLRFFL